MDASGRKSLNSAKRSEASLKRSCTWAYTWDWVEWRGSRGVEGSAYVLDVKLFLLVSLEYLEELLVGIGVIGVASLYLVEVLYGVVEFACWFAGGESAEEGGCGGCGRSGEGEVLGLEWGK